MSNFMESWKASKKAGTDWLHGFMDRNLELSLRQSEAYQGLKPTEFGRLTSIHFNSDNMFTPFDVTKKPCTASHQSVIRHAYNGSPTVVSHHISSSAIVGQQMSHLYTSSCKYVGQHITSTQAFLQSNTMPTALFIISPVELRSYPKTPSCKETTSG
ncbi:hypothetical protein PoB_003440200 [Plakobranchus ocellatus]|uniref:HTH CENPB-type domain-containing protein n=1 Tax=Plakobranchus ocellatus TaxID=259542 RepID=A0AAV4AKX4_9GAST|nr:hypothetical protein PoB_003440200 [Plakobranchus ocellatus]